MSQNATPVTIPAIAPVELKGDDGRTYLLQYKGRQLRKIKEQLNIDPLRGSVIHEGTTIEDVDKLLLIGLERHNPTLTLDDVADLYDARQVNRVIMAIMDALVPDKMDPAVLDAIRERKGAVTEPVKPAIGTNGSIAVEDQGQGRGQGSGDSPFSGVGR